ncbi:hypothetical protein O6H91_11G065100 [Diphasiastrum complanatum]|uniref:Uncharacterized protein n=1 Tax=Diphasiastrum complanatum TaxID=34168 RepID=A0ACC2C9Z7_DIPCM|nr:hypothetical protein O6H91_11G065100 [Diphasiastrum complanatum]
MWELGSATIQGRAPKVISTALFEDVFPDYISPALVSLIAKHAPQELDLFEHVLRSLKNSAHVSRPEVGHQKKYSKARSQRQRRNEATNNPTASKFLSSPAKNCKSQNISKRLLIFSPETPRRTDKGTCLLLESETVPLENGIQKFEKGEEELLSSVHLKISSAIEKEISPPLEAPCSRTSAVASSSTTMISSLISKEENTDACHIRPEQLAKEVTIQYECMPDEIASGSRNPFQVSQLDFKDSAACMEATSNYSEETGRSTKASMLDKPTKPAQASRNYVPTSKRVRGETRGQNHKLVELKKIQNQKPDNVVSSTERRSPGSRTSNEKPWRHGMKLVKEDIGAMTTSSATWKDQKAPVLKDERASITRNKQRIKEFDLKRRLELHKEDSHCKTKRPNYQRPPWDPDCSLPCCDDNGPWQRSPQMEDFEIDLPFPQHTYVGPGSVHIQPESVGKTYWQCDDDGVLQIFHYKNRNFFSQEISIKQLESFHNDHFMEGHLKHQYPKSKRADGYMRHRNGAHHAEFRREKGKAAWKDNKSGSNMPSVSTRLPSDKRIKDPSATKETKSLLRFQMGHQPHQPHHLEGVTFF